MNLKELAPEPPNVRVDPKVARQAKDQYAKRITGGSVTKEQILQFIDRAKKDPQKLQMVKKHLQAEAKRRGIS